VTGGAGFIGGHLCRALVARGYEVRCVDRAVGEDSAGGVEMLRADVSVDSLDPLLEGCDAVIHLAALPGVRAMHSLSDLWHHNAHATARLVEALGTGRRLVLASTSSVYGNASRLPTPESSPTSPLNPYAVTKLAGEGIALACARRGADIVVCRLFTVFGPGQRSDMAFSRWIDAVDRGQPVPWCAPPDARREFTYVDDAVRGLVAALEHGRGSEIYNLAGTGSTPVRDALAAVEDILGCRARLSKRRTFSEAAITAACGRKAHEELAHVPRVGLREGLERQVEAALDSLAVPLAAA
jgi:nucleoside-diphosphate-sugar epimerase